MSFYDSFQILKSNSKILFLMLKTMVMFIFNYKIKQKFKFKAFEQKCKNSFFFTHFFDLRKLGTSVFCKQWCIWGCNIKVYDIFECCFQGFQILTDRFLKFDQGCQIYRLFIILECARILRMRGITLWAGNLLYESFRRWQTVAPGGRRW